jgi:hypothetical protein
MVVSRRQNVEQDHNLLIANKYSENVAKFMYFGTKVTNQIRVHEEVKVKVKVNLSLCLTKHHAMKAYWEWRYSSTHSLTSALDGGEWSASCPCRCTAKKRAPGTHWI